MVERLNDTQEVVGELTEQLQSLDVDIQGQKTQDIKRWNDQAAWNAQVQGFTADITQALNLQGQQTQHHFGLVFQELQHVKELTGVMAKVPAVQPTGSPQDGQKFQFLHKDIENLRIADMKVQQKMEDAWKGLRQLEKSQMQTMQDVQVLFAGFSQGVQGKFAQMATDQRVLETKGAALTTQVQEIQLRLARLEQAAASLPSQVPPVGPQVPPPMVPQSQPKSSPSPRGQPRPCRTYHQPCKPNTWPASSDRSWHALEPQPR